MGILEIADRLVSALGADCLGREEFGGQLTLRIDKGAIGRVCRTLKEEPDFEFNLLLDVCGLDYPGRSGGRFDVVYHLFSLRTRNLLRLKVQVDEADPQVESVTSVWTGANWHERECYDMFGIRFEGHPDLRRILMPEDWEGYPLRKDYPLKGPDEEHDWQGFREIKEIARRLSKYEWES